VEAVGLTFHTDGVQPDAAPARDGNTYWNESAAYVFTAAEADMIRDATAALHGLCVQAAHQVADRDDLLELFGIPLSWRAFVRASLRRGDPSLYGPWQGFRRDPHTSDADGP